MTALELLAYVATGANLALAVYWFALCARANRLNAMLLNLCLRALTMQASAMVWRTHPHIRGAAIQIRAMVAEDEDE